VDESLGRERRSLRRVFRVIAELANSEVLEIDVSDPRLRELCDSPDLHALSDSAIAERVRGLMLPATHFIC
jgi:hypothetical protein